MCQALFSTKLHGASFGPVDWSGLNLENADLSGINLRGEPTHEEGKSDSAHTYDRLAGAILTGCNLSGCKFVGTNLEEATLPEGMSRVEIYRAAARSTQQEA